MPLRNMFFCILGTDFKAFGCKNLSDRVVETLKFVLPIIVLPNIYRNLFLQVFSKMNFYLI